MSSNTRSKPAGNSPKLNIIRDAAELYIELGFDPVPLKGIHAGGDTEKRQKAPTGGVGWQARARDPALKSPRSVRSRYRADMNLGLLMGRTDGHNRQLFAVDIDAKNGGSVRAFVAGREWPDTPADETPSGGQHFLFLSPPGMVVQNSQGQLGVGIDIVGENGQVVVEPSRQIEHPGRCYRWLKHPRDFPIAEAPLWLLASIERYQGKRATWPLPEHRHAPVKIPLAAPTPIVPRTATPATTATYSTRSTKSSLAGELIGRFVLTADSIGLHNALMVRMGPWVILNTQTDEEAYDAYATWWDHYHQLGVCGEVVPARISARVRYLRRRLEAGKIRRLEGNFPHREQVATLALGPRQRDLCQSKTFKIDAGARERGVQRPNLGHVEAFLSCLILACLQSRLANGPGNVKFTVKQMQGLLRERFGFVLDSQQFDRLKKGFVRKTPRPGQPAVAARWCELLREVREGTHYRDGDGFKRIPSEFEVLPELEAILALPSSTLEDEPVPQFREAATLDFVDEDDWKAVQVPRGADEAKGSPVVGPRLAAPPVAVEDRCLAFPARPGLTEIVRTLIDSGRFGPDEVAGMLRDIRPAQASRSSRRDE